MKRRGYITFRAAIALFMGFYLVAQSSNPDFLRPAVASRAGVVHAFVALFGAAFLVQAYVLIRDLRPYLSR